MSGESTKLFDGKYLVEVPYYTKNNRMYLDLGFNKGLRETVKRTMEGRKWHGPPLEPHGDCRWSIPITQRNLFRLEHMKRQYGCKPYAPFDKDYSALIAKIKQYCSVRLPPDKQPYEHQFDLMGHAVSRRGSIWGAEMGTGKTLAAFIVMELYALWYGYNDWLWTGPKSALRATHMETGKWNLRILPPFHTYEQIKEIIARWEPGHPAPQGLWNDEGSKLKTPNTQRSIAVKHLADSMRQDHAMDCFVGLMTGTPAPKSPLDWWHLCEVACPGYLAEKDIHTFKDAMAIVETRERAEGNPYPHLVTFRDNADKCHTCGQLKDHDYHNPVSTKYKHAWLKSVNEVARLHERMKGLVVIKFKKDCLDLPAKIYEIKKCDPTPEIINLAKLIIACSRSTIDALIKLRMLSDGFQYTDVACGEMPCELCNGTGQHFEYHVAGFDVAPATDSQMIAAEEGDLEKRECVCPNCNGDKVTTKYRRETQHMDCPKDELLLEDLDAHEEVGRLNVYGGFQGTVDKVVRICHKTGWTTIKADGRGWEGRTPTGEILPDKELLSLYDQGHALYPRMCFIGQPGAAGMGLTLTASPTTVFFSNDFNAENRYQAEDRGHRIGMDRERGCRITDYVHLDTDTYVLENLKKKRDLQYMSMTGLSNVFNS